MKKQKIKPKKNLIIYIFVYNNLEDFTLVDVKPDEKCGYRALSLQLQGDQEHYNLIRQNIFTYLDKNKEKYENFNFEYEGEIISSTEYIDKIKNNAELMGDLEISACINIYNAVILVFELNDNNESTILNKYGDQISEDKYY